jgi:hypothetical protein
MIEDNNLLNEIREDMKVAKKTKKAKKVEPEVKKKGVSFWTKLKRIFLILVVTTGVALYAGEWYADWRAGHEWQFPTKWIGFFREIQGATNQTASAEGVKVLTDIETLEQYKLSPVLKTLYFLESTSGQKDGCKDEGKFNGFGYAQNTSTWKCYDSFADVAERVNEWFEDRLSTNGNDLIEAVCLYNTGFAGQLSCGDYSANFFSVLTKNF